MVAKKKLEKVYGFVLSDYDLRCMTKVFVIGCGGNGSHLVSDLARFVSSFSCGIEIVLVDGDVVEQKNLVRQHFAESDLGKNKAEVLASRYGNAYGAPIGFVPEYLTDANKFNVFGGAGRPQLFITCTDNLQSRKIVSEQKGHLWVDLGNEEFGGQVTFSSFLVGSRKRISSGDIFPTPHVFELFPEYQKKIKKETSIEEERGCADIAAEAPAQAGFVNVICASIAKNYIHALLTKRPVKNYQTFFTIDNTFEPRSITESVVTDWIEKYKRFKGYTTV